MRQKTYYNNLNLCGIRNWSILPSSGNFEFFLAQKNFAGNLGQCIVEAFCCKRDEEKKIVANFKSFSSVSGSKSIYR
jgi:hypothetical protein